MTEAVRHAACRCGQFRIACTGEPVRVSVCHCRNCKARSGSAFAAQARFPADRVRTEGEAKMWQQAGDSGNVADFFFCGECGATLWYRNGPQREYAVPLGNFEPGHGLMPRVSVYEERRDPWVAIVGEGIEHLD
ncbi:MAG: GFA family protein [Sphingopyxis granuli]